MAEKKKNVEATVRDLRRAFAQLSFISAFRYPILPAYAGNFLLGKKQVTLPPPGLPQIRRTRPERSRGIWGRWPRMGAGQRRSSHLPVRLALSCVDVEARYIVPVPVRLWGRILSPRGNILCRHGLLVCQGVFEPLRMPFCGRLRQYPMPNSVRAGAEIQAGSSIITSPCQLPARSALPKNPPPAPAAADLLIRNRNL